MQRREVEKKNSGPAQRVGSQTCQHDDTGVPSQAHAYSRQHQENRNWPYAEPPVIKIIGAVATATGRVNKRLSRAFKALRCLAPVIWQRAGAGEL